MSYIKRGKTYHFSFYFHGKRYRLSGKSFNNGMAVRSKLLAEKIEKYINSCIDDDIFPQYIVIKETKTLISFKTEYLEWAIKNKKSWKTDEYLYNTLIHFFGNKALIEIKESEVEKYKLSRIGKVTNNTINHELALLSNIYRVFNILNQYTILPPKINKLKIDEKTIEIVDDNTMNLLINNASSHLKNFILLVKYTGLRPSEALNLQGKHFRKDYIIIEQTKTKKVRYIPINENIKHLFNINPEDYVINYKGNKTDVSVMRRALKRLCKKLGINKNITPYSFRHTFATQLLQKTDIYTIQRLMGHTDIKTTQKYLHFLDKEAQKAIKKII